MHRQAIPSRAALAAASLALALLAFGARAQEKLTEADAPAPVSTSERPAGAPGAAEPPGGAATRPALPASTPATLDYANRHVASLRAPLTGSTPAERVHLARLRLEALPRGAEQEPVTVREIRVGDEHGQAVLVGGRFIFAIGDGDVEPLSGETPQAAAAAAAARLEDALHAWRAQQDLPRLLRGVALAAGATLLLALLLFALVRLRRVATDRLGRMAEAGAAPLARHGLEVVPMLRAAAGGVAQVLFWILALGLTEVWLTFVLGRFPLTEPWADTLRGSVLDLLGTVATGAARAVPDLVVAAVILLLTRGAATLVTRVFEQVQAGRLTVTGVHPETARATRRISLSLVWLFGLVAAYPYLPGSGSEAFKGLGLLLGLMVSLGSTGVVAQAMSGLVLIYSRSLTGGDYVRVGDIEGVVSEAGMLSTKIVTLRGEEVTLPNTVVVGGSVWNYTRQAAGKGPLVFTKVTIGYDAPWRQVDAMLRAAALRTRGVRLPEEAFVLQTALSDFYVEYELRFRLERPVDRSRVTSELHGHIQDVFNEAGVQIMSPHFVLQPRQPVVIPKEGWNPGAPDSA